MLNVRVNGRTVEAPTGASIANLLETFGLADTREGVAVALNDELVPRARWNDTIVGEGDSLEIVQAVQGGTDAPPAPAAPATADEQLTLGKMTLSSRLILGSSRYPSMTHLYESLEAAQPGMVTVALRRVSVNDRSEESLWQGLKSRGYAVLPNTAGCFTAREAILTAQLGREALGTEVVKLEVIGDERTLYPDAVQLIEAARELIKQGFVVMPYCSDDPILCQRLEQLGCPCVMPLAAPIGSGLGIRNPHNLALIRETVQVPVIVDAGVGTASDVAIAMELGMDGVLLNTAIAGARDPVSMARAIRHAMIAGRLAYRAGRIPRKAYADASSPVDGLIETRFGRGYEKSFPEVPGSRPKRG